VIIFLLYITKNKIRLFIKKMLSNKNLTLLALVVLLSLACVGEADFAGNQLYKGGRRARIPGGDQFI
jgi:hypothetical protein